MNASRISFHNAALCAAALCLAGCNLLNPPKGITPRSFVLTPIPAASSARPGSTNVIVGIKRVKVPQYLSEKTFAVRHGANEIVHLESAEWAEPLDTALQRVLAANLCSRIPTDQVRLSLWTPGTVTVEVDVDVERFDVDSRGEGVLRAWWRVLSPGGDKVLGSGRFAATRKGPPPNTNPEGAAASMSSLAADLAEKLAEAISAARPKDTIGRARSPHPGPLITEREKPFGSQISNHRPANSTAGRNELPLLGLRTKSR